MIFQALVARGLRQAITLGPPMFLPNQINFGSVPRRRDHSQTSRLGASPGRNIDTTNAFFVFLGDVTTNNPAAWALAPDETS
ncbi:MAG: hypothetical protein R3C28_03155 [Pirellulaceae bacterium]